MKKEKPILTVKELIENVLIDVEDTIDNLGTLREKTPAEEELLENLQNAIDEYERKK